MVTIGILGGVASGKSLVAKYLAECGAGVLDADAAGHQVLADPETVNSIVAEFGESVLDAEGASIDRSKLASQIFSDDKLAKGNRAKLEAIMHPAIRQLLETQAKKIATNTQPSALVFDVPLLLEVNWQEMCDMLVFVDTPPEMRQEFAATRGWEQSELDSRQDSQMGLEEKRSQADHVISNIGTKADLRQAVRIFWETHVVPKLA